MSMSLLFEVSRYIKKEHELSQCGEFINSDYKARQYEVAMCDFHHSD